MSTDPIATFVEQLRHYQLLDEGQLAEVERLQPTIKQLAQLARELVQRGWLTTYQANQLALGRGNGLVIGSYLVLAPIGGGGMGQVVKARHRIMNRDVALKIIRQDQLDSPDFVRRFQREVQMLAELRHPHIVHAYDAGQIGETWYLAMELLEGCDLDRLVRDQGPLPVGQACRYIRQAALGLHFAHQRGLVHRDVKPSNLFLTSEGVKVLDLGLARQPQFDAAGAGAELTRTNTVMGTPDYLSPEQALNPRQTDQRSDLYGLGCTFYFLLTGRPPFLEGSLAQKLLYHQQVEPAPVEQLRPEVPPALAELVRQLLAKKPEDRPANALAVAVQLAPLSDGAVSAFVPPGENKPSAAAPRVAAAGGSVATAAGLSRNKAQPSAGPKSGQPIHGGPMPTQAVPASAVSAARGGPPSSPRERDEILSSETIMPTGAPAPSGGLAIDSLDQSAGLRTDTVLSSSRRSVSLGRTQPLLARWWLWAGAAAGAGVLLLALLIAVLGPWSSSGAKQEDVANKDTREDIAAATKKKNKQAGGKIAEAPKQEKKPANPPKGAGEPVVKKIDFPPSLEAKGVKETEGLFLLPTIAPDTKFTQLKPGDKVFLSDLKEFAFKTTPTNWPFAKAGHAGDPKNPESLIQVNGDMHPKGLGMHPPNTDYIRICYALGGHAKSLHGAVALDDGEDPPWGLQTTTFVVIGDGQVLWRSQGIKERGVVEPFHIDVRGIAVLELRVYTDYNGANGCRAAWLDPYVVIGEYTKPRPPAKSPDKGVEKPGPQAGGNRFPGTARVVEVRASHQGPPFATNPKNAFDGDLATRWDAGAWPPAWIEADLGKPIKLKALRLNIDQRPDSLTVHEVWISHKPIGKEPQEATKIHTFSGFTRDKEVLSYAFPAGTTARYVQIKTTTSRSWVSWNEIAIDAAD